MNKLELSMLKMIRTYQIYYYTSTDDIMQENWDSFLISFGACLESMVDNEAMSEDIKKVFANLIVNKL